MRLSLKESRTKLLNAITLDRKSGIRGPKTMGEAPPQPSFSPESLTDRQHNLPHNMSLFNSSMRLNDLFERKHLGPKRYRLGTDRSIQPVNSLTRHLTIASQDRMAMKSRCGLDSIRISKGRLVFEVLQEIREFVTASGNQADIKPSLGYALDHSFVFRRICIDSMRGSKRTNIILRIRPRRTDHGCAFLVPQPHA